jgi:hypothetical protein
MGEKLVIGPINRGLRTDRLPFVIDNDSFPTLTNAYQWRGRVKRKRGTTFLCRLQRLINTSSIKTNGSGNFSGNILTGLEVGAMVVFNSIKIGTDIFTDSLSNGHLTGSTIGTGTINYVTGALTITGGPATTNIQFSYYPNLPVMGLEDFNDPAFAYPQTLAFDTTYSYSISTSFPYTAKDVSFYKNPLADATTLPGYTPKSTLTALTWNGENYQQFWTTNYQGALWATNGVDVPFTGTTIGMQFAQSNNSMANNYLSAATWVNATTITFTISNNVPLVVGDFVFANEFTSAAMVTPPNSNYLNFQTGYVTVVSGTSYTVVFPFANIPNDTYTPGILQYLTNRSNSIIDNIRWYDGDNTGQGWVNFMPPLSQGNYVIEDAPAAQYYLVGAKIVVPFKDRLLFFGPAIQTSTGDPIYLQDTCVFSLNGTPYYTASFTPTNGNILNTSTVFNPILVPANQTAVPFAYWEDQFGFGGYRAAGIDQAATTVSPNEDALIVGFDNSIQTRFIYSGNDLQPFDFYIINAELGSGSTFSAITMDDGVITRGPRGFIQTSQTSCRRVDLDILDQTFEISELNNGAERFTAVRDFINEWIYFTYSQAGSESATEEYIFPTQTLLFNYRDNSWAIFNESYTTYGQFRPVSGFTWATLPTSLTWDTWNDPWNAGQSQPLQPQVIGGNAQGFVLMRSRITSEATSLFIDSISGNTITSPNHSLNNGDYIYITGCLGIIGINNMTFSINNVTQNTFNISPPPTITGTYIGGGLIQRMYVPFIQSKQFPTSWDIGRKVRLGPQQYLFSKTNNSQITLEIFLSQDNTIPYNDPAYVDNDSLVFTTILFTCPESTNLGLTPFNTNLQMLAEPGSTPGTGGNSNQQQIWHRMNTSLIGDTVQFGFTMSDAQMRALDSNNYPVNAFEEIEFHAAILDVSPAGVLA